MQKKHPHSETERKKNPLSSASGALFEKYFQDRMEEAQTLEYARIVRGDTVYPYAPIGQKIVLETIKIEKRRTIKYAFPPPTNFTIDRLIDARPANPDLLTLPPTNLWFQFAEPLFLGDNEEPIMAFYLANAGDPSIIKVIQNMYRGLSAEYERQTEERYVQQLGIWELVAFSPLSEEGSYNYDVLYYDATLSRWSHDLMGASESKEYSCSQCSREYDPSGASFRIECTSCQQKRKARTNWLATVLALLAGRYQQEASVSPPNPLPRTMHSFHSQSFAPGQQPPITVTITLHDPPLMEPSIGSEEGNKGLELENVYVGVAQHPTKKIYQVWVTCDLEHLSWVSVHRFEIAAQRLKAIVDQRRVTTRDQAQFSELMSILSTESEGTPVPFPPEEEWSLLEGVRISARRPRFERSLRSFSVFSAASRAYLGQGTGMGRALQPIQEHVEAVPAPVIRALDETSLFFLDHSALKMCEVLLAPDERDLDPPRLPLWIEPMAPLWFDGKLIRGLWLNSIPSPLLSSHDDSYSGEHPLFPPVIALSLGLDPNYTQKNDRSAHLMPPRGIEIRRFAFYMDGGWHLSEEGKTSCPDGRCQSALRGEHPLTIPCSACAAELDYWGRWIKTALWIVAGRFRRANDTTSHSSSTLRTEVQLSKGKGSPEKSREYRITVVKYDASYFKPIPMNKKGRGRLKETHLILLPQEAEAALQVNLEGVLICDWSPVRGYWRQRRGGFKRYINPKKKRTQYVTLATWKARQEARARSVLEVRAEYYEVSTTERQRNALPMG